MLSGKSAHDSTDRELPSRASIDDWGRRVNDARARLSGEIHLADMFSPLDRDRSAFVEELELVFEELQVAEEELHVQTDELSTSRAQLEAERLRYRTLFEHAPLAYIVTDENGNITDVNRAGVSFLGLSAKALHGKPLIVFVPPSRRRAFRERLISFKTKDVDVDFRLRVRPRLHRSRAVTASVGIVHDSAGSIRELRWLLVVDTANRRRERTRRSRKAELARTADAARQAAERANREKSELIAIVSHELRTPLTAIGGYAELLALEVRGALTAQQRMDVQRIQQAQAHLVRLLDDLVGYSKLETGLLRLDIGDNIVRDAVEAHMWLVRPQAAAKDITVSVGTGDARAVVRADAERLRQIMLNLLANAIKFTPRGGHVAISWSVEDADVQIHIRDDGIGIPTDKLEEVFEPHIQLASSQAEAEIGWGLGLAISRDLARAMGGDLTASNAADHGAIFTLRLPRSTRIATQHP